MQNVHIFTFLLRFWAFLLLTRDLGTFPRLSAKARQNCSFGASANLQGVESVTREICRQFFSGFPTHFLPDFFSVEFRHICHHSLATDLMWKEFLVPIKIEIGGHSGEN